MDYQDLCNYFLIKHNKKIEHVTKHLQAIFKIKYVSYQRIYPDGKYCLISNMPHYNEYYFKNKFYDNDPFLVSPDCYKEDKSTYIITNQCSMKGPFDIILDDCRRYFNLSQAIIITKKHRTYTTIFCFSTGQEEKYSIPLLLNEYAAINRYMPYFENKMSSIIDEAKEMNINIAKNKETFFQYHPIYLGLNKEERTEFLKLISAEEQEIRLNLNRLTFREQECLQWLIYGKTAAETSEILHISRRTVEIHRENIRKKLGHYSFSNLCYLIGKYQLLSI